MIFGLGVIWFALTGSALAGTIPDELRRLEKCHGLFVGERISKSSSLYLAVSTGASSGTDACMALLDRARLGSNGRIPSVNGIPDQTGHRILANLVEFHRSQLESPDFNAASGGARIREMDIFDANEPAFHFVYSLLMPNEPYSNVVKRAHGIRAIRYTSRSTPRTRRVVDSGEIAYSQGPGPTPDPWNPTLIDTGKIAGLVPDSVQNPVQRLETGNAQYEGRNTNAHFGGGFLGSQAYMFATWNGSNFRNWAKDLMADALCKDIPVLRSIDVLQAVRPTSTFSWRQGISCMQCHETMDPLSAAMRTQGMIRVSPVNQVRFWVARPIDRPSAPYPSISPDPDYSRRPPDFSLKYRSFDGSLVELPGTGITALGQALAERDDLYVCAAKRYFQFLTGIETDIRDDSDPLNPLNLSPSETKYRNRVIELGRQLRQDQSAREMFKRIISSPTFIYPDRGV
jgi:hypothetical protein